MFTHNLSGTHVEMRSLWELVTSKLPRLAAHLRALSCDISILATDWFMCLFATSLPSEVGLGRAGGRAFTGPAAGCRGEQCSGSSCVYVGTYLVALGKQRWL